MNPERTCPAHRDRYWNRNVREGICMMCCFPDRFRKDRPWMQDRIEIQVWDHPEYLPCVKAKAAQRQRTETPDEVAAFLNQTPTPRKSPSSESRLPVRNTDRSTARKAAKSVNINARQQVVLSYFEHVYPRDLNNEELIDLMGEEQVGNVSSRVSELRDDHGALRLSGNERKSRQRRSQQCHVFVPVAERSKLWNQRLDDQVA